MATAPERRILIGDDEPNLVDAVRLVAKPAVEVDEDLKIDFSRAEVYLRGQRVQLTPTEYRLLYHLASNPGRVLPYETILAKVWGMEYREEEHYVRLYVNYLRQKIEPAPGRA